MRMTWMEAILRVLESSNSPLTIKEIMEDISFRGYYKSRGKTPEATVHSILWNEIQRAKPRVYKIADAYFVV
jgi:predicted Zn-ribbon and HTH transcriptional regulator